MEGAAHTAPAVSPSARPYCMGMAIYANDFPKSKFILLYPVTAMVRKEDRLCISAC